MGFKKAVRCNNGTFLGGILRLGLVFLSTLFLWWVRFNLYCLPALFLYIDFFTPLVYLGALLIVLFVAFKFRGGELKYKFLGDYGAKHSGTVIQSSKFLDLGLDRINLIVLRGASTFSLYSNRAFKRKNFNVVVALVFLIFLLC